MAEEQVATTAESNGAAPEAPALDLGALNLWGGDAQNAETTPEASGEADAAGEQGDEAAVVEAAPVVEQKPTEGKADDKAAALPETWQKFVDEISRRDSELKTRERRLTQLEKSAGELDHYRAIVEKLKSDPLGAIQAVGGDPTTALQKAFGVEQAPMDPTLKAIKDEIAALRAERDTERQTQTQHAEEQRRNQARMNLINQYSAMAKSSAERYPHLAIFHEQLAPTEMFAIQEAHARATGQLLQDEEAAAIAEGRMKQQVEGLLDILSKNPVYASRFVSTGKPGLAQGGASQNASTAERATAPRGTALRNKHTAESSSAVDDDNFDPANDRAILERAAKVFHDKGGWGAGKK